MWTLAGEAPAATAAPWWGTPLVAGIASLVTALVGIAFTYMNNQRQDKRRWEKDLRTAAADFHAAAFEVAIWTTDDLELRVTRADRLIKARAALRFLAPEDAAASCDALFHAAIELSGQKHGEAATTSEPDSDPYLVADETFVNAVRKALGQKPLPPPV